MTDTYYSARLLCAALLILGVFAATAQATEPRSRGIAPPPPLQFPTEADAGARFSVAVSTLVPKIELVANTVLCSALMKARGETVPEKFEFAQCPDDLTQRILNEEGDYRWANHGKPSECTSACIDRPYMGQVAQTVRPGAQGLAPLILTAQAGQAGQPTLRRAMLSGKLAFVAEIAGETREATYYYTVSFVCQAQNAAHRGVLETRVSIHGAMGRFPPVEGVYILDMEDLAKRLATTIGAALPRLPSVAEDAAPPCRSVGIIKGSNVLLDRIAYDPPLRGVDPSVAGSVGTQRKARIEFLRVSRKPMLSIVPFEISAPGDPAAGWFTVYANGIEGFFALPANAVPGPGGSVAINFCKTIDMKDADRVQVILANGLGGSTWSQFEEADGFGVGEIQTMTTGRIVDIPKLVGPGQPDGEDALELMSDQQSIVLREFTVQFRITLTTIDTVAQPVSNSPVGFDPANPPAAETAAAADQPPPQPCQPI